MFARTQVSLTAPSRVRLAEARRLQAHVDAL